MQVEINGRRAYVLGDTFAIKDRLKEAGCKWDPDRRAWYIGAAKAAAIEKLIGEPAPPEDLSQARVFGKAEYKGRAYYVIATSKDGSKHRLTVLDGSIVFWADATACKWTKTYEPKQRFGGYGRGTITQHQTLGSLRRFVERQKNPTTRTGECTECGHRGPMGQSCSECGGEGSYA